MNPLETTLQKVTKIKPNKGEDRQDYLLRLVQTANEKAEEDNEWWEALPTDVAEWVNDGSAAHNDGNPIIDFSDDADEEEEYVPEDHSDEEEEEADMEAAVNETKPAKKTAPAKKANSNSQKPAATPAKVAKPAKEKVKAPRKERPYGGQQMIKKILLKQPTLTTDELLEKLEKQNFKVSKMAVSSIRSGFRDSLRVIKDAGYLDDVIL